VLNVQAQLGGEGVGASQGEPGRPRGEDADVTSREGEDDGRPSAAPGSGPRAAVNPSDWSQSKVTWRNKEMERSDPDFVRHHGAYRPSYPPGPFHPVPEAPYMYPQAPVTYVDPVTMATYYGPPPVPMDQYPR
jgi:hypothetical protein